LFDVIRFVSSFLKKEKLPGQLKAFIFGGNVFNDFCVDVHFVVLLCQLTCLLCPDNVQETIASENLNPQSIIYHHGHNPQSIVNPLMGTTHKA
jgi:hypothetical protein